MSPLEPFEQSDEQDFFALPEGDYLRLESLGFADLDRRRLCDKYGKIVQLTGNLLEAEGLNAAIGDICSVEGARLEGGAEIEPGSSTAGAQPPGMVLTEVIGFSANRIKLSPLTHLNGVRPGGLVKVEEAADAILASEHMLGRVFDGLGQPLDSGPPIVSGTPYSLNGKVSNPLERPLIEDQLDLGVRCINALLPIGKGQRIGIFAGSGVGKSTLLGMMARYTAADVNVIALIGERGREVNEFLKNDLGPEGIKRSVIIAATSDQPATVRLRAAYLACALCEFFRDLGKDVLFMMDSATRLAMAAREIGLAAGEPPTTKGYTPSVFSLLPRILERSGKFEKASITGIYTVLVEGDDMEEPVADTLRSILDGHIVLDRDLAQRRHFPAIDILRSVSRLTGRLLSEREKELVSRFIRILADYKNSEDMIRIGAYARGSHKETDYAIDMIDRANEFLMQQVADRSPVEDSLAALENLLA
ncbi:MAG: FliI/YscN family ATPase [Syntrophobacteraceae bacterium]|nr:FliI/YscN family ATPase [Syntrophobacteraceae bacterium]